MVCLGGRGRKRHAYFMQKKTTHLIYGKQLFINTRTMHKRNGYKFAREKRRKLFLNVLP